ncbi:uncharacterized protein A1O5_12375 [Cladophialophora psammophila CBS 110553]|uniref:Heterokaryon incompatibility domain-containing protein n=1 Tax=Cladophialophora psammophila CBS 110553 TaxID=1182543 RepID=W9VQ16_9EURO|nr:uncharacterized protein A1O5_12375 [Cladophialophora psammophila CBS 110553]EXJ57817.1 hypothetical protein A1O5_12375 [Cladophialophora psammophila CBS 110553]
MASSLPTDEPTPVNFLTRYKSGESRDSAGKVIDVTCIEVENPGALRILPLGDDAQVIGRQATNYARPLNPLKASRELMRNWLRTCEHDHQACKNVESRIRSRGKGPKRLINVRTMCVEDVPSLVEARYFALSYVWGNASRRRPAGEETKVKCAGKTLAAHRVVRDAIELTREFDETYLWVDSFCIRQDDAHERASEIAQMNNVYASALMTIVALASDNADSGLDGVRRYSGRRCSRVEQVDGIRLTTVLPSASDIAAMPSCKWNQRAWTMQEQLFSRRILYMGAGQAYFSCLTAAWSEDRYEATDDHLGLREHPGKFLLEPPDDADWWNVWQDYTEQYSARLSTEQEDRFYAFQGILNEQKERWDVHTVCALPVRCLPLALYWFHGSVLYESLTAARHRINAFPSWSWIGWSGRVNFPNYRLYRSALRRITIRQGPVATTYMYNRQGRREQTSNSQVQVDGATEAPNNKDAAATTESTDSTSPEAPEKAIDQKKYDEKPVLEFETSLATVIAVVPRSNRSNLRITTPGGQRIGTLHSAAFVSSFDLATGEIELACTCMLVGTSHRPFFWQVSDDPVSTGAAATTTARLLNARNFFFDGPGSTPSRKMAGVLDTTQLQTIGPLIPQEHGRLWHAAGAVAFMPVGLVVLAIVAAYYALIFVCVVGMWPLILLLALALVHPVMYALGFDRVAHVIWIEHVGRGLYERRGVGEVRYRPFMRLNPEVTTVKLV